MAKKKKASREGWGGFTVNVPFYFEDHRGLVQFMRKHVKYTQKQLAKAAGTTQSVIARLETSKAPPSLATLSKVSLACGFGMTAPYFACKKCGKNISDCQCKQKSGKGK